MEAIKTYLDNVFAAFPKTTEVQTLKRDMLANMEEKYVMLRQGGKSEHEAAYSVIANFGNIEEITAELGLSVEKEEMDESISDESIFVSNDDAKTYIARSKRSGVLIGFGVFLIMAGVSSLFVLDSMLILFPMLAVAVAIFIMNGNVMSAYEDFEKKPIRIDDYTRNMIEREFANFEKFRGFVIAIGVALIILSVGFYMANDNLTLLLNIVGFSLFLFIAVSSLNSSYEILLGKGDYVYEKKKDYQQVGRIIGTVAAIYWPVVTAIFLLWRFVFDAWSISWIIWPVSGLLFGAISGGVSIWFGTKEKSIEK